jgi:hypothetical protein
MPIHRLLKHLIMRSFQLALVFLVCFAKTYGQTATRMYGKIEVVITREKKPKKIYTKVEISPAFAFADSFWVQSLEKSLNQSSQVKNRVKAGKYIVSVRFLLEKDGSVTDITCLNDPGFGMCEQVITLVKKKTAGWSRWSPAKS